MAKSTQLELIRDLAQSREHGLAAEVSELRRLKTSAEVDLNRLDSYLSEYTLGMSRSNPQTGRSVTQVENERRFVRRLNIAVEQQRIRARQFSERVNMKIQSWQRERAHLDALERAVEQRRIAGRRIQERREQTDTDTMLGHRMALKIGSAKT